MLVSYVLKLFLLLQVLIISLKLIPAGSEVNPKHRPIIHASGIVTLAVPEKSTFLLSLEQYISSLRSSDNSKKPLCPLRCIISDSKRWGEKGERKPKPKQGTYVSVTGFISGISRGSEGKFEAFEVEIENVTYLGKPSTPMASWSDTPSRMFICLLSLKTSF